MMRTLRPAQFIAILVAMMLLVYGIMIAYMQIAPMNVYRYAYPMWIQAHEAASTSATGRSKLLVLGDSRAKAGLIPESLGPTSISLTLPGGAPYDFYLLLQEYLKHNPAPETMALVISPHHFHYPDLFWSYSVGFGYLDRTEFEQMLEIDATSGDAFLGNPIAARIQYFLEKWRAPHLHAGAISASLIEPHNAENLQILEETRQAKGHKFFGTSPSSNGHAYETQREDFVISVLTDCYFQALLTLTDKNGIATKFIVAPINAESYELISPAFRQHFTEYLGASAALHPTIEFDQDWPVYGDEYFGDANHLNAAGAKRFSAEVRERLTRLRN